MCISFDVIPFATFPMSRFHVSYFTAIHAHDKRGHGTRAKYETTIHLIFRLTILLFDIQQSAFIMPTTSVGMAPAPSFSPSLVTSGEGL